MNTKIAGIIPEFAINGKANVNIYQMMTHTVNLWSMITPPVGLTPMDMLNLEKVSKAACNLEPMGKPGTRAAYQPYLTYSILGYCLVLLDEKKRSYSQIAKEELFDPLGMKDTSISGDPKNPCFVPYDMVYAPNSPFITMVNNLPLNAEWPAVNVHSTAGDMLKLAEMYRNNGTYNGARILSPSIIEYAMQNHTGDLPNDTLCNRLTEEGLNPDAPMNYTLAGGYIRGNGSDLQPHGQMASPKSFCAMGGGSTVYVIDPERKLTVVCLKAGLVYGYAQAIYSSKLMDMFLASLDEE